MLRLLASIPFLLTTFAVTAQSQSTEAPIEAVGMIWVWGFVVLFVGCCVGFGWMVWRNEKRAKVGNSGLRHHPDRLFFEWLLFWPADRAPLGSCFPSRLAGAFILPRGKAPPNPTIRFRQHADRFYPHSNFL